MTLNLILILVSVILGAIGQILMKQGALQVGSIDFGNLGKFFLSAAINPFVVGGLAVYFLSSLIWIVVLSRVELSFAYPLISIGYVLVLVLSALVFKEKVLGIHYAGVILIISGVVLITRGR